MATTDPKKGRPSLEDLQKYFVSLDLKGQFSIGLLDNRHILIHLAVEEDYLRLYSRMVWHLTAVTMRIFKWSPQFHVDKESSFVPVWIALPRLPVHFFAKAALFQIASLLGTPLRMDAATQSLKRPSIARLQIEIDLLQNRPTMIWIGVGENEGFWQQVDYEHVPQYCICCWHVGHEESSCRFHNPEDGPAARPPSKPIDGLKRRQHYVAKSTPNAQQKTQVNSDSVAGAGSALTEGIAPMIALVTGAPIVTEPDNVVAPVIAPITGAPVVTDPVIIVSDSVVAPIVSDSIIDPVVGPVVVSAPVVSDSVIASVDVVDILNEGAEGDNPSPVVVKAVGSNAETLVAVLKSVNSLQTLDSAAAGLGPVANCGQGINPVAVSLTVAGDETLYDANLPRQLPVLFCADSDPEEEEELLAHATQQGCASSVPQQSVPQIVHNEPLAPFVLASSTEFPVLRSQASDPNTLSPAQPPTIRKGQCLNVEAAAWFPKDRVETSSHLVLDKRTLMAQSGRILPPSFDEPTTFQTEQQFEEWVTDDELEEEDGEVAMEKFLDSHAVRDDLYMEKRRNMEARIERDTVLMKRGRGRPLTFPIRQSGRSNKGVPPKHYEPGL